MGILDIQEKDEPGFSKEYRVGFSAAMPGSVDTSLFNVISSGPGQTMNQANGALTINTGTAINSETILRAKRTFTGDLIFRWAVALSQRIANQSFYLELVDVIGDNLTYTINSATSVTVKVPNHGFDPTIIGQSMYLGGIADPATVPGRYALASISGENLTFTVAGWPSSGTGVLSIFGRKYQHVIYDGATATTAKYDTQRLGYNTGESSATINTTVAPGHVGTIATINSTSAFLDQLTTSSTTTELTQRASRITNVPAPTTNWALQIRAVNGASAPASSTALTVNFVSITQQEVPSVAIAGVLPAANNFSIPVQIAGTPTVTSNLGTAGTGTTSLGKAEDAPHTSGDTGIEVLGVRVPASPLAQTSAAGDYGAPAIDQEGKQVAALHAADELSWQSAVATITTTTATPVKAAAAAGVRNYVTDIDITNTSATETRVDLLDGATVLRSWNLPGKGTISRSFSKALKGTAATAVNVQSSVAVTDLRVAANGYLGV